MNNSLYSRYHYNKIIPFNLKKNILRIHSNLIGINPIQKFWVGDKIKFWYYYFAVSGLKKNNSLLKRNFLNKKLSVFFISNFNMIEGKWIFPKIYVNYYEKYNYINKKKFNLIKSGFILNNDYSNIYLYFLHCIRFYKQINYSYLFNLINKYNINFINIFKIINMNNKIKIFFKYKKLFKLPIFFIKNIKQERNIRVKKSNTKGSYINKYRGSYNKEGFLNKYKKRNNFKKVIQSMYLRNLKKIRKLSIKWKKSRKVNFFKKKYNNKIFFKKIGFKYSDNFFISLNLKKRIKKLLKKVKLKKKLKKLYYIKKSKKLIKKKRLKILKKIKLYHRKRVKKRLRKYIKTDKWLWGQSSQIAREYYRNDKLILTYFRKYNKKDKLIWRHLIKIARYKSVKKRMHSIISIISKDVLKKRIDPNSIFYQWYLHENLKSIIWLLFLKKVIKKKFKKKFKKQVVKEVENDKWWIFFLYMRFNIILNKEFGKILINLIKNLKKEQKKQKKQKNNLQNQKLAILMPDLKRKQKKVKLKRKKIKIKIWKIKKKLKYLKRKIKIKIWKIKKKLKYLKRKKSKYEIKIHKKWLAKNLAQKNKINEKIKQIRIKLNKELLKIDKKFYKNSFTIFLRFCNRFLMVSSFNFPEVYDLIFKISELVLPVVKSQMQISPTAVNLVLKFEKYLKTKVNSNSIYKLQKKKQHIKLINKKYSELLKLRLLWKYILWNKFKKKYNLKNKNDKNDVIIKTNEKENNKPNKDKKQYSKRWIKREEWKRKQKEKEILEEKEIIKEILKEKENNNIKKKNKEKTKENKITKEKKNIFVLKLVKSFIEEKYLKEKIFKNYNLINIFFRDKIKKKHKKKKLLRCNKLYLRFLKKKFIEKKLLKLTLYFQINFNNLPLASKVQYRFMRKFYNVISRFFFRLCYYKKFKYLNKKKKIIRKDYKLIQNSEYNIK